MTRPAVTIQAIRRASLWVGVGLVIAALFTELRKPAGQRTWQGHVAGVVPYNFRISPSSPPALGGQDADSDRLLVPRSFGVGWSLNVAAVARRWRALKARRAGN